MKVGNISDNQQILQKQKENKKKIVNPLVFKSLQQYQLLKKQLYDHFFEGKHLNIDNKSYSLAYSNPYNLMNDSSFILQNDKQFENVQTSFLSIYNSDLITFSQRVFEQIIKAKGFQPQEQIRQITKWINTFARFNHWMFKTFMVIQRNAMKAQGIKLYFEGIKILKANIFDKIYQDLYHTIFKALQLYKEGLLRSFEPLQILIKYIGIIGFSKLKLVAMQKIDDRFQYQSKKQGNQTPQNPYKTDYFKTNFTNRLAKDLKSIYTQLSAAMMQLSTPEYFQKAKILIEKEKDTADHFYSQKETKQIIIRNILQILIMEKATTLLKNPKSGLARMMHQRDMKSMSRIYDLLKEANMQKEFFKEFQNYIQSEGQQLMSRITAQDDKAMKKQTIQSVFGEIIRFNQLIDQLRVQIDPHDAQLQKAQNAGFQGFCNVNNRVCNYLAYYADLMLKKQDSGHNNAEEIVVQIGKISKYLYSYDYFMNMYQKLLGLRLLYDNFKNQEAQFALIAMLKNEAGLNSTSKITNMISDHKNSQNWNTEFGIKNKFGFGLDVMMLTSGSWQINDPKCGRECVPDQLQPAVAQFESKFLQKMPNRSVSWIFTHGRAIMQLLTNNNLKFVLVVNNYQLLALLQIKKRGYTPCKYGDLLTVLKIQDQQFFKNSLMSLLKNGVLVKQGGSVKIQSKSDQLMINFDFKYKTQKVGCSIMPRYTDKVATQSAPISAERSILIDAALVKIMKQRRRAPYHQVILQVQKMCKTFKAEIPQIKTRIQNCQQRQFLERDANDMNILIYKP